MIAAILRRFAVVVAASICIHVVPGFAQANSGAASANVAPSKRCTALNAKVAREEKALGAIADAAAKERKARATCTSKILCARYDSSIQSLEKRLPRQEARVSRFKADAALACAVP
jgi:hypothetical protein